MKFLVIGRPKANPPPIADHVATNQEAKATIEKWLKDGSMDCAYQFIGGGGFSISNADSAENLLQAMWSYPLFSQFEWHVEPIVDILKAFDLPREG